MRRVETCDDIDAINAPYARLGEGRRDEMGVCTVSVSVGRRASTNTLTCPRTGFAEATYRLRVGHLALQLALESRRPYARPSGSPYYGPQNKL